jgi:pseudouridine-5'-phosphate glycosidase
VPVPRNSAVDVEEVSAALAQAEAEAEEQAVHGQQLTPFLLARLAELTDGATLRANTALLEQNALRAAELAIHMIGK